MSQQSRQRPLVIHYTPRRVLVLAVSLLLLAVSALYISYWSGFKHGFVDQEQAEQQLIELRALANHRQIELEQLSLAFNNSETDNKVQRLMQSSIRTELNAKEKQILTLKSELNLYRSVFESGDDTGLSVYSVDILPTEQDRRFHYRISMIQKSARHNLLKGTLQLSLIGLQAGQLKEYAFAQLNDQMPDNTIKLRFKYFQFIVGELTLPEGFEAKDVKLIAESHGRSATKIERNYPWLIIRE